jgi:transaldolase
VTKIYNYYKQQDYKTIVMAASFRSVEEVLALAGCDRLTISPDLMAQLESSEQLIEPQLQAQSAPQRVLVGPLSEAQFRWQMNEDAMATEKLAEGIRNFTVDQIKLEQQLLGILQQQ